MRIHDPIGFTKAARPDELLKWSWDHVAELGHYLRRLARAINGQLSFGDGRDSDNIKGQWATVLSLGTPGAEVVVPHTLGVVPVGFLVFIPPESGTINRGTGPWTTSQITVNCSAAGQNVRIFIVAPPT